MGRADQTTKVKGMFVRPEQVAEIGRRHPELKRLRLMVTREAEADAMTLAAETAVATDALKAAVGATLQDLTKLKGASISSFREACRTTARSSPTSARSIDLGGRPPGPAGAVDREPIAES